MPVRVVVSVDSTWDTNTAQATAFRQVNVIPYLEGKGLSVNQLNGPSANKNAAKSAVQAAGVAYIIGVSHGLNDTFSGDQDRPVFTTGLYDPTMFGGKMVHFLACNTAFYLGRNLVQANGASAFFGYCGPFSWPDNAGPSYAAIFFDCDAEIDRALADGASAGTAAQRAIAKYDAEIASLRHAGDGPSLLIAAQLERNRDLLCTPLTGAEYGSVNAVLR